MERSATAPLGVRPLERTDVLGHRLAYAWDEAGRRVSLTNENGSRTTFRYDLLIEETGFDGKVTKYTYNAAGELGGIAQMDAILSK